MLIDKVCRMGTAWSAVDVVLITLQTVVYFYCNYQLACTAEVDGVSLMR